VPHDAVRDLEDPRQLVERLWLGIELEQVDPVRLLVDLVRELAPAPGSWPTQVPPASSSAREAAMISSWRSSGKSGSSMSRIS
jgi:hypothetical protein